MPRRLRVVVVALTLFALGCTAAPPTGDTGVPTDSTVSDMATASLCRADVDCSDGVFCNGAERCAPAAPGANARGCVVAPAGPCAPGQSCDEGAQRCREGDAGGSETSGADTNCDGDGDGITGPQCGGMDCDDADPDRYPGNRERCGGPMLRDGTSPAAHDEDCNPCTVNDSTTLGDGDVDADRYPAAACRNPVTVR